MPNRPLLSREDVLEKINHEGGLQAALEYGLTEDDMPGNDPELRSAWYFLRIAWELADRNSGFVDRLIRTPLGEPTPVDEPRQ